MERPPLPPAAVAENRCLGRYEILRRLGRGGMAEVFEARHLDLGKRVAVKVLQTVYGQSDGAVDRLLREGRAASAIHHPNVVSILDVGMEQSAPYLVMELLEGEDLAQRLEREGALSVETIADAMLPVISGLAAAHAAGVVHRDLKPSNIFLARRHHGIEPVIVDFGISKLSDPSAVGVSAGTGSGGTVGTVRYMAPEQVSRARVTAKSDQYALGVILFECATGGAPFWGDNVYELLHAIMTATAVAPSELNPSIPASFDAIVLRALDRDPERRFPDVLALGSALLPFASARARGQWEHEPAEQRSLDGFARTAGSPSTPERQRRGGAALRARQIAGACVLAGAALGVMLARPRPAGPTVAGSSPEAHGSAPARVAEGGPASQGAAVLPQGAVPAVQLPATAASAPGAGPDVRPRAAPSPRRKPPAPATPPPVLRGTNDVPILEVQ